MHRANIPAWMRSDEDDWRSFFDRHKAWARERVTPDGILSCLPSSALNTALQLYRLNETETVAETDFAALCLHWSAIGWCSVGPLRYQWLEKPRPLPKIDDEQASKLLECGWTQNDINALRREEYLMSACSVGGPLRQAG